MKKKISILALMCCMLLSSCEKEYSSHSEMIFDLSGYIHLSDGNSLNLDVETNIIMNVGSEIVIKLGDEDTLSCKWISSDTSVVIVMDNTIKAVGVGKAKITDENGSNRVINIVVQ